MKNISVPREEIINERVWTFQKEGKIISYTEAIRQAEKRIRQLV